MRRAIVFVGICALMAGLLPWQAHAQIAMTSETRPDGEMVLDINLRDADLGEVLAALFNTTGGRYQMLVGAGVIGRIPRLQLTQAPFEKAVDAVLGTEYSYTKEQMRGGAILYRITSRQGGAAPLTPRTGTGAGVTQAPPAGGATAADNMFAQAGTTGAFGSSGTSGMFGGSTGTTSGTSDGSLFGNFEIGSGTGGGITAGATAATESTVVRLLAVNYADIGMLCEYLGGNSVNLSELTNPEGGYGGGGARGTNNRNNTNYRDNTNNRDNTNTRNTNTRNTNNRNTNNRNTNTRNNTRNR